MTCRHSALSILYRCDSLLVGVFLDINEVVSHGLVGQLMQDGADGVKTSLHYQQLGLGLSLLKEGNTQ